MEASVGGNKEYEPFQWKTVQMYLDHAAPAAPPGEQPLQLLVPRFVNFLPHIAASVCSSFG